MDNFIEYYKCGGKTKTSSKPKKVKSCACGSKIKKSNASKKSTQNAKLKIAAKGMKMKGCGCGSKLYRVGGRIVEMDCNNIIKAQQGDTINRDNDPKFSGKYNGYTYDEVLALQKQLKSEGLYDGNLDGIYGPETDKALKDKINNYINNLVADPYSKLWLKIGNYSQTTKVGSPLVKKVESPLVKKVGCPLVKKVQESLRLSGDYSGPIDGINGPEIKKAIKRREQRKTMLQLDPSISTLDIKSSEKKPTAPVVEDLNERPDLLYEELYMPENRLSYRRSPLEY